MDANLRALLTRAHAALVLMLTGEQCDHSTGICYCEEFAIRDDVDRALRAVDLCRSCGAEFPDPDGESLYCDACLGHNDEGDEPDPGDMDGDHASALESVYGPEDAPEYDDPMIYGEE